MAAEAQVILYLLIFATNIILAIFMQLSRSSLHKIHYLHEEPNFHRHQPCGHQPCHPHQEHDHHQHQPLHRDPLHPDQDHDQAARDARGRVVAAEGEHRASRALRHAAEVKKIIYNIYNII